MSNRTINWGDSEVEAAYQTGDDDPDGGGNFIVARDTDGGVTLLEYDPVAGEWVARSDVTLDGNDLSAGGVGVERVFGNAVYPTIGDVPAEYEQEGNMVYTESDGLVVFES